MALNDLKSSVVKDAEGQAKELLYVSKKKANEVINEAKQKEKAEVAEGKRKALESFIEYSSKEEANVHIQNRKEILEIKNKLIGDCLQKVAAKVSKLSNKQREEILKKLLGELANGSGDIKNFELSVASKDKAIASKLIKDEFKDAGVTLGKAADTVLGCSLQSSDGRIVYNNTFESRMEEKLPALRKDIVKLLFGG